MKSLRPTGGYTIVEVMIVLAVTGGLLASAMTLISGQQRRTEFTTAVRDFESRMQDLFNDVETGYYANNGQLTCTVPSLSGPPQINTGAAALGTNEGCIFLGKAIRFEGTAAGAPKYETYTIAGKRKFINSGKEEYVTTLDEAVPRLFYAGATSPFETTTLSNGLRVSRIWFIDNFAPFTLREAGGLAILSGISAADSTGKTVAGGDTRGYLASINVDPNFNTIFSDFHNAVNSGSAITASPRGVIICINDGSDRLAAVGVGVTLNGTSPQSSSNRMATELFFDDQAGQVSGGRCSA